ncbi:MAG TPA: pilus assembly PilX N-terminal domain-containing protein [Dehalococcoidales bacterium]|nr:pilus assembly PilX N-terminal domain-containing protein [Dehalococcoidales bacterium]
MKKREAGQAFILVLIILAIGSLLVVPALKLTSTSLQSSRVVTREVEAMYAADGAQEYVLWKLLYDGLGANFTYDGENVTFPCNVCGKSVDVLLIMRAVEGGGGINLATNDVIRPMKTVAPSTVPNDVFQTFTYTIRLEQLSDNNTQGLDVIYDILPKGFGVNPYLAGSSYLRVDGGEWESISDPLITVVQNQVRLRWPASGNFSSPIRDFAVRQVKELKFQVAALLPKNTVHCNWAVLKPWDTISGPQAPITVGSPANPGICSQDGLIYVTKYSEPEIIQPGVVADIKYTVNITNQDGFTHHIEEITDYLPAGFTCTDNSTSGLTTLNPQQSLENINGVDRWKLLWTTAEFPGGNAVSIAAGQTLTLTFWAQTTKDVSGSYYNEVELLSDVPVPKIFLDIGIFEGEYFVSYSWNSGAVIVPAYDSQADADQVLIDANMALILGGIAITSWQIY